MSTAPSFQSTDKMAERVADILVSIGVAYAAFGLLFAIAFTSVGAKKVDPQTVGSGLGFRILLLPGVTAFWPLLLRRWIAGRGTPEEWNPHR